MKRILMLLSLYAILCHTSCKPKTEEKKEATKFLVTSPVVMDTTVTKEYVSQIRSIRNTEIRTQEKGYLQGIYVDEGQYVKKGQLLFKIMPQLYEAEMEKSQAEVNAAEIEVQNTTPLAEKNIVSKNELAMAKAKLAKAKAELQLSKVHLAFTEIRAPFDGLIDRLHMKLGSLVEEGELLTDLSDNSQMWVYFNVSEQEYLNYQQMVKAKGQLKVKLRMANNEIFEHTGTVETIEADFNNETGNIAFRATFPNPKSLLRNGETGSVQVTDPIKNAMLIPQKATFEVLEKKYVYVIDKDNTVKSREITIAAELPHIFIIKDGLAAGDKILLEGLRQVKENEKIEFRFEKPEEVLSHLELYAE